MLVKRSLLTLILLAITSLTACRKLIAVDPPVTQIATASVYTTNAGASAVMTGVYDNMAAGSLSNGTSGSIGYLQGLASDELANYSTNTSLIPFYQNALSNSLGTSSNYYYWTELYKEIYACNAMLNGLASSTGVTSAMKQQLTGEAKFMRAFLYFYAVNLYGDVPLLLTTDYQINAQASRTQKADVYHQIITDLLDAQAVLSSTYVDQNGISTTERIRPNKWAATALLARVYLYTGDWKDSETQANAVISNTATFYNLPTDLTKVFTSNSAETIFQLHPVGTPYLSTAIAVGYVLTSAPGTGSFYVAISPQLQSAFEPNDKRFVNWVGSLTTGGKTYLYPYKYRIYQQNTAGEYIMMLRLSEQYLIRAEARAEQNNVSGSQADLNVIRTRAGLSNTSASDQISLLTAIAHERQVELFTEWGDRWFNLIRTGAINSILGSPGNVCAAKGGTWSPNWALLPIALNELLADPNLKQNPGY